MRVREDRRIVALLGALVVLACAPALARAATLGADLNNAPNSSTTCGQGFAPFFIGSSSCMYYSGAPGPSPYAPASGTITAVHVRMGATTGPVQVVILRSLYQNKAGDPGHPYFACCFVERYGPIFTPQVNTVTTVQTSLPVTEEATPPPQDTTTNAAGDFIALSVLAANVPIPAFLDGSSGYSGYYPAPTEGTNPAPAPNPLFASTDGFGAQILLSAELDTGGGGTAPAPGAAPSPTTAPLATPAAPAFPSLVLPKLTIPVKGNTATVPIQCLVVDCAGILNLQSVQLAGAARTAAKRRSKQPKVVSYGTASFSLKAGATGKAKVKLNAAGRKLVKAHKKSKVWANVRFTSGGGSPKSTRVTLKR